MSVSATDAAAATRPVDATVDAPSKTSSKTSTAAGILEAALREAFGTLMTLVDEEDAVLLYRCSRIAQHSPLLLESCDMRRTAIEEGLAERCERLWQSARLRLLDTIAEGNAEVAGRAKEEGSHRTRDKEGRLEAARRAASVRERQHEIEREAAVKETLRLRAEEDAAALARAREAMREEIVGHKRRAWREVAEARGACQQEVRRFEERAIKEAEAARRLRESLAQSEAEVTSMAVQLASETEAARAAAERCRDLEMELELERQQREGLEARAQAAEAARLEALADAQAAHDAVASNAEVVRLSAEFEAQGAELSKCRSELQMHEKREADMAAKQGEFRRRAEAAERELQKVRASSSQLEKHLSRADLALKAPPPIVRTARAPLHTRGMLPSQCIVISLHARLPCRWALHAPRLAAQATTLVCVLQVPAPKLISASQVDKLNSMVRGVDRRPLPPSLCLSPLPTIPCR